MFMRMQHYSLAHSLARSLALLVEISSFEPNHQYAWSTTARSLALLLAFINIIIIIKYKKRTS